MQLYDSIPAVRYLPLPFKKAFEMFKVLSDLSLSGLFLSNFTINNWKTLFERCPMKDISRCSLKPKRQEFRVNRDILLTPTWMNWKRWVLCCRPVSWDTNFVPFLLIHYLSLDKRGPMRDTFLKTSYVPWSWIFILLGLTQQLTPCYQGCFTSWSIHMYKVCRIPFYLVSKI